MVKKNRYDLDKLIKESEKRVLNEHEIYFLLEKVLTSYMPQQQRSNWNPLRWFFGKDILRHQGPNTSMLHTGQGGKLYFDANHEYNPSNIDRFRMYKDLRSKGIARKAVKTAVNTMSPTVQSSQGIDPNMDPDIALKLIYGRPDKFQGAQRKALIQYFKDRQAEKVQVAHQQSSQVNNRRKKQQIAATRKANEDHMVDADRKNQELLQKKLFNRYAKTLVESMSYEQVKDFIKSHNINKDDILRANPNKGIDLTNPDHLELVNTYRLARGLGKVSIDPSGEVITEKTPVKSNPDSDFKAGLKNWQVAADILGDNPHNGGMSQVYGADDSLPYKDNSIFSLIGNGLYKLGRKFGGPNAVRHAFIANGQYDQDYINQLSQWAVGAMKELGVVNPNEQPTPEAIHNFLTTWNTPVVKLADGTPITRLQLASAYKAGNLPEATYNALINQYEHNATDKNGNRLPVYLSMGEKKTKKDFDNFGRQIDVDDGTTTYNDIKSLDDDRLKNAIFTGNIATASGAPVDAGLAMQKSLKSWLGLTPQSKAKYIPQATNLSDRTTRSDKNGNPVQVWADSQGRFVQPNYGNTPMSDFTKQLNAILSNNTLDANTKLTTAMDDIQKANVNDTYKQRLRQLVYQRLGMTWDPSKERYIMPASRTHSVKNDQRFIKLKQEYDAKLAHLNNDRYPDPKTRGKQYRIEKNQLDKDYQAKVHKLRLATGRFTGATSQAMLTATDPSTTTAMTLTSENTYVNALGSLILAEAFMKRFVLNNVNFFSEITAGEIEKALVQANTEKKAEESSVQNATTQSSDTPQSEQIPQDQDYPDEETNDSENENPLAQATGANTANASDTSGNLVGRALNYIGTGISNWKSDHDIKKARLGDTNLYGLIQYALYNPYAPIDEKVADYLTSGEVAKIKSMRGAWLDKYPNRQPLWAGDPLDPNGTSPTAIPQDAAQTGTQTQGVAQASTDLTNDEVADTSKPNRYAPNHKEFDPDNVTTWGVLDTNKNVQFSPQAEKHIISLYGGNTKKPLSKQPEFIKIKAAEIQKQIKDYYTKKQTRKNIGKMTNAQTFTPQNFQQLFAALNRQTNGKFQYDPSTNSILTNPANGSKPQKVLSASDNGIKSITLGTVTKYDNSGNPTAVPMIDVNYDKSSGRRKSKKRYDLSRYSESSNNVLSYNQFIHRFKESIQKHSSEISSKNMYQLYLLGKLKKLL